MSSSLKLLRNGETMSERTKTDMFDISIEELNEWFDSHDSIFCNMDNTGQLTLLTRVLIEEQPIGCEPSWKLAKWILRYVNNVERRELLQKLRKH